MHLWRQPAHQHLRGLRMQNAPEGGHLLDAGALRRWPQVLGLPEAEDRAVLLRGAKAQQKGPLVRGGQVLRGAETHGPRRAGLGSGAALALSAVGGEGVRRGPPADQRPHRAVQRAQQGHASAPHRRTRPVVSDRRVQGQVPGRQAQAPQGDPCAWRQQGGPGRREHRHEAVLRRLREPGAAPGGLRSVDGAAPGARHRRALDPRHHERARARRDGQPSQAFAQLHRVHPSTDPA
mmetsp:Transcript_80152/g.173238  ORF Transcript_80152/g.173238 Transcript_80152/m.173238 type:complete len:235 (-) Transcript_80152:411-1115(-)